MNIFRDRFDRMPEGWTASHETSSPSFTPRNWMWVNELPDRKGSGFFAPDPTIGICAPGGDESGVLHLDSPSIALKGRPSRQATSTGLRTTAFSGSEGGSVEGSWRRSFVNLTPHVGRARRSAFASRSGVTTAAACSAGTWTTSRCARARRRRSRRSRSTTLPCPRATAASPMPCFTISLSHAYALPVSVRVRVKEGTADEGNDYVVDCDRHRDHDSNFDDGSGKNGHGRDHDDDDIETLTIKPLTLSAQLIVKVRGDKRREATVARIVPGCRSSAAPESASVRVGKQAPAQNGNCLLR